MLPIVTSTVAGCSTTASGKSSGRTAVTAAAGATSGSAASSPRPDRAEPATAVSAGKSEADAVEQLAARIERVVREALGDSIAMEKAWKPIDVIGWSGHPGARVLALTFTGRESETPVAVYYLVAWQPLFAPSAEQGKTPLQPPLLTVTGQALVFGFPPSPAGDDPAPGPALHAAVSEAVKLDWNQRDITDLGGWVPPKKLRIITVEVHPHHALVQAALPGSGLPHPGKVAKAFPHRMVRLSLVPDRGRVIRQWIAPEKDTEKGPGACPCRGNGEK